MSITDFVHRHTGSVAVALALGIIGTLDHLGLFYQQVARSIEPRIQYQQEAKGKPLLEQGRLYLEILESDTARIDTGRISYVSDPGYDASQLLFDLQDGATYWYKNTSIQGFRTEPLFFPSYVMELERLLLQARESQASVEILSRKSGTDWYAMILAFPTDTVVYPRLGEVLEHERFFPIDTAAWEQLKRDAETGIPFLWMRDML